MTSPRLCTPKRPEQEAEFVELREMFHVEHDLQLVGDWVAVTRESEPLFGVIAREDGVDGWEGSPSARETAQFAHASRDRRMAT